MGQKVCRYLQWLGVNTKIFNVGEYRRANFGAKHTHDWFAPNNEQTLHQRTKAAMLALEDMITYDFVVSFFFSANFLCHVPFLFVFVLSCSLFFPYLSLSLSLSLSVSLSFLFFFSKKTTEKKRGKAGGDQKIMNEYK